MVQASLLQILGDNTCSEHEICILLLCRFMQKNQSTFFLSAYDGTKGVEGKSKD